MASSAARIEANRRNAQKSTGPRTEAGKAIARLNAFQHGLAGAGDLLAPGEDAVEVDRRSAEIAEELGSRGRVGAMHARRAAVMSLRLERAEERDFVGSAARASAARREFDDRRRAELDGLIADLDAADDPRPTLAALEASPEGVRFLAESWVAALTRLRAGEDDAGARRRLGASPDEPAADLVGRGEADLLRLRKLAVELDGTAARAIAAARHQAGVLASFDASTEGERARRHEAAAERSFHRACRAIAEARRDEATPAPASGRPAARTAPGLPARPAPDAARPASGALGSFPPAAVGSFLLDAAAPGVDLAELFGRPRAIPGSTEARRARPDLARVAAGRR